MQQTFQYFRIILKIMLINPKKVAIYEYTASFIG